MKSYAFLINPASRTVTRQELDDARAVTPNRETSRLTIYRAGVLLEEPKAFFSKGKWTFQIGPLSSNAALHAGDATFVTTGETPPCVTFLDEQTDGNGRTRKRPRRTKIRVWRADPDKQTIKEELLFPEQMLSFHTLTDNVETKSHICPDGLTVHYGRSSKPKPSFLLDTGAQGLVRIHGQALFCWTEDGMHMSCNTSASELRSLIFWGHSPNDPKTLHQLTPDA